MHLLPSSSARPRSSIRTMRRLRHLPLLSRTETQLLPSSPKTLIKYVALSLSLGAPPGQELTRSLLCCHSQVLSTAIKVDPSLPNPPEMSTDSAPAPFATPAAASPSSKPKLSNGVKKEDASSDMSEEDVPLASKAGPSRSPSIPKEKDDKPLAKLPKMKRKESYEAKKEKKANEDVKMDSEDEEDVPLKKTAPKRAAKGKKAFQDEDRYVLLIFVISTCIER